MPDTRNTSSPTRPPNKRSLKISSSGSGPAHVSSTRNATRVSIPSSPLSAVLNMPIASTRTART